MFWTTNAAAAFTDAAPAAAEAIARCDAYNAARAPHEPAAALMLRRGADSRDAGVWIVAIVTGDGATFYLAK